MSNPSQQNLRGLASTRNLQGILAVGHLANDWAPAAIWLLAPAIGLAFDLQPSQIGLLITLHSVGAALAYLPAGILSDRVQRPGRLLLFTFWWVGLGYFLASFAPDFWILATMLAIAGMGDATWHPIATGVLARRFPARRGLALGIHALGGTLAEVFSPLVVGILLSVMDWRSALQLSILPSLIMGVVFYRFRNTIPVSRTSSISRVDLVSLLYSWTTRKGLALITAITTYNMALIALMTISPLFVQRELGYSTSETGLFFALAMLVGATGQPLVGRWSDRIGRQRVFVCGLTIAGTCALLAAVFPYQGWTAGVLIAAMAILVVIRSGLLAMAVDYSGKREATTLGFVFALMDGVGALGALTAGFVGDFELRYGFALAAGFSLISIGITAVTLNRTSGR
jgi:MFS family permease